MSAPVVTLWVDDATVGCGERTFVVISVGPKRATLLSPASLDRVEVDRKTFDKHAKPIEDPKRWRAIAKRMGRNAKDHARLGMRFPSALVKKARALLNEEARA